MTHPTYPLQHEQRAVIIMDGRTAVDVARIQKEFAKRRNVEFPGWRETYEAEIGQWLALQKKPSRA
jgi:hypothetical protein